MYDSGIDPTTLTTVLGQVAHKLRALIVSEITENAEAYAEVAKEEEVQADPSIQAMKDLVANIETGKDATAEFAKIQRLIHNQDARAEVFSSLGLTHDYSRYAAFLSARRRVELVLLAMSEKAKLTPGDALALLTYLGENIKAIEHKISANTSTGKDIASLLGKIDFVVSSQQQDLSKKLAATTPQNREIMRRVAHRLLKASAQPKQK